MDEPRQRVEDRGAAAIATHAAKTTSKTLWAWIERHHIDALAVIGISLWLTIRVVEWAMDFADTHYEVTGAHIPAIIASVLTPWGLMQAALFKFYADLKGKTEVKS